MSQPIPSQLAAALDKVGRDLTQRTENLDLTPAEAEMIREQRQRQLEARQQSAWITASKGSQRIGGIQIFDGDRIDTFHSIEMHLAADGSYLVCRVIHPLTGGVRTLGSRRGMQPAKRTLLLTSGGRDEMIDYANELLENAAANNTAQTPARFALGIITTTGPDQLYEPPLKHSDHPSKGIRTPGPRIPETGSEASHSGTPGGMPAAPSRGGGSGPDDDDDEDSDQRITSAASWKAS